MALKDYMAISGHSGLFKFVAQGRNGIIVESLTDGKRMQISATSRVSTLSDISIFTDTGDVPLSQVLESIKELTKEQPTISHKSSEKELRDLFASVLPDYDQERVYISDIRKVLAWYNQLQKVGMLDFSEEEQEATEEKVEEGTKGEGEVVSEEKPKATPKKKEPAKKTEAAKKTTTTKTSKPTAKSKDAEKKEE